MSDMFWEDDDRQPRESNAMKALREKAEADSKKITELTEQLQKLSREVSESRVERVVTTKGFDPRVAALAAAAGVEPTDQAVEAWLKEFGDVFVKTTSGQEPAEATGEEQSGEQVVPDDEQVALAALAAAAQGAEPAKGLAALESQLRTAPDEAALLKLLGVNA